MFVNEKWGYDYDLAWFNRPSMFFFFIAVLLEDEREAALKQEGMAITTRDNS